VARGAVILVVAYVSWVGAAVADDLVVIVHPERVEALDASDIVQIYLKQRRFWSDGTSIVPVNREAGSPSRETFSRVMLGGGSRTQIAYWNRQYFRGVLPPITLASDEAVLRFVAEDPRAIGYIPSSIVDDRVHVAWSLERSNED